MSSKKKPKYRPGQVLLVIDPYNMLIFIDEVIGQNKPSYRYEVLAGEHSGSRWFTEAWTDVVDLSKPSKEKGKYIMWIFSDHEDDEW